MAAGKIVFRPVNIIRWIARTWSILIFVIVLLMVFVPDPYATEPVPLSDWFLLGLWGAAVLGLLVAWHWELAGGILAIAFLLLRELTWIIMHGSWEVEFLIIWMVILPPAALFLLTWWLEKRYI